MKTQREDDHSRAKERDLEQILPSYSPQRNQPWWHLNLRFLVSRTEKENFCCLSQIVCGTLLQQPW